MEQRDPALLSSFKSWLEHKYYSSATVRNYLVDLGKYLNYVNALPQSVALNPNPQLAENNIFSSHILSPYLSSLINKTNGARYTASLNQFCQFAVDQGLISQNPIPKIIHALRSNPNQASSPSLSSLVNLYQQYLTVHHSSPITIKNYINDLNQYINWLETQKIDSQ